MHGADYTSSILTIGSVRELKVTNYHSHQVTNYLYIFRVVTKPEMINATVEDIT